MVGEERCPDSILTSLTIHGCLCRLIVHKIIYILGGKNSISFEMKRYDCLSEYCFTGLVDFKSTSDDMTSYPYTDLVDFKSTLDD